MYFGEVYDLMPFTIPRGSGAFVMMNMTHKQKKKKKKKNTERKTHLLTTFTAFTHAWKTHFHINIGVNMVLV